MISKQNLIGIMDVYIKKVNDIKSSCKYYLLKSAKISRDKSEMTFG